MAAFEVSSTMVKLNETDICVHTWTPDAPPKGVVIVYHGFLAHGRFPTVRYAADEFAKAGLIVVAADMRGHGRSAGLKGYLAGPDQVLADGVAVAKYACQTTKQEKVFLAGSSMGGTIALSVAQKMGSNAISGVVLLAPMLKLPVDSFKRTLLLGLNSLVPTWEVIPSKSTDAEKQARNPQRRQECENDELTVKSSHIRIGSASTCVELASEIKEEFASIEVPFLVLVADEDEVVDSQGSLDLFEQAPSKDKRMQRYPALHALLCEPSPLVDTILDEMIRWVQQRL